MALLFSVKKYFSQRKKPIKTNCNFLDKETFQLIALVFIIKIWTKIDTFYFSVIIQDLRIIAFSDLIKCVKTNKLFDERYVVYRKNRVLKNCNTLSGE